MIVRSKAIRIAVLIALADFVFSVLSTSAYSDGLHFLQTFGVCAYSSAMMLVEYVLPFVLLRKIIGRDIKVWAAYVVAIAIMFVMTVCVAIINTKIPILRNVWIVAQLVLVNINAAILSGDKFLTLKK